MCSQALLAKLIARQDLTTDETREFFRAIMQNKVEPPLMGAVLATLAAKGETTDEIVGAASAMREHATPIRRPPGTAIIDTCGTGGDGKPVFNISSTVAIVAAAAGATVAKHGNRSNVRPSGSAEVLQALGINIEADVPTLERCLEQCRITFLYAVRLHPAMKHAAPVRRALAGRTLFNLVGPLTNPAGVRRQLLGVNRADLVEKMLEALGRLGAERAMVVHGLEGLCDLSIAGPSHVGRLDGMAITFEQIDGTAIGIKPGRIEDLFVASPSQSADLIRRVLAGEQGPARDAVILNSAAALWVAGLATEWRDGARAASEAIDSGAARDLLAAWATESCRT